MQVFQRIYKQIYIPTDVYKEIEAGKAKKYYKDLSGIDWINIIEIHDKQAVKYFLDLDAV